MTDHVDDRIEAYLEGELDAAALAAFESHLSDCARCGAELELAGRIADSLRRLPRLEAPAGAVAHVLATAREEASARSSGRSGWGWLEGVKARPALAAVGAVVMLAIALVTFVYRSPGSGGPAPEDPAVLRATLETKLALAHFARANRRVGRGLSEDLLRERLVRPAVRSLSGPPASAADETVGGAPPQGERG